MARLTLPTLLLVSALSSASATTERLARRIPQLLQSRATYNGGWAIGLEGSTCPSDTPVACDTNGGYVNPTCCPKDQKCFGYASPYCCPGTADCSNVVQNFPVCAKSTWNLYVYDIDRNYYFCCPPGQYGVLPVSGNAGICKPVDQAVASSLVATPTDQAGGGGAAATTVSGIVTQSTSTVTRTSTLAGGSVTVVTTAVTEEVTAEATEGAESSSSSGSGSGSSGSKKKSSALSTGAIVGIAIGALFVLAAILLGIWWRKRQARQNMINPSTMPEVYVGGQGHTGVGSAPLYSTTPQPYQSPVPEYKSPAISSGYVGSGGGYGPGTPPSQYGNQQMGYAGTPPPVGGYGPPPVEAPAPLRWNERAEMGTGRT